MVGAMEIKQILNDVGKPGSIERLEKIANLNLGERSEAARRVLYKRERRQELMNVGMSFEITCLVVNREMEA